MAVYNTESGSKIRIDKGNNTFVNGKCVNPLSLSAVSITERSISIIRDEPTEREELQITGHVPNFEFGWDAELKKSTQVNTGHTSW